MRRQRTVVGSPDDEDSSSPLNSSLRYDTRSPRSMNSEGTFDRSFNVGSVIGHDDPTLIHTNIKESLENSNYGALDSFLTASFSEEENRDSVDTRRANQKNPDYTLRQQLVELDRRQDAWRAGQQEIPVDMDDTGDFYLKEVGELTLTSPKKKSFILLEETIYEEVSGDIEFPNLHRLKSLDYEVISVEDEKQEDADINKNNQFSSRKEASVEVKIIPHQCPLSQTQQITVKNLPRHSQLHQLQRGSEVDEKCQAQKQESHENSNNPLGNQKLQYQSEKADIAIATVDKNFETIANNRLRDIVSADSSTDKGVNNNVFENNPVLQKYKSEKKVEILTMHVDRSDPAIDHQIFDDIKDSISFPNTYANAETKNTNEIIKAVQERLFDSSSNKTKNVTRAKESFDFADRTESAKINLWSPATSMLYSNKMSSKNTLGNSQTLASKVDGSNDEDDNNDETVFDQKRRKSKLCFVNTCLALVIVSSIVCSALFAIEFQRSRSGNSRPVENTIGNPKDTTESERNKSFGKSLQIEDVTHEDYVGSTPSLNGGIKGLLTESQAPWRSISSNSPSDSPSTTFQISSRVTSPVYLPTENFDDQQLPTTSPTLYLGSLEETLQIISGEGIHNISSPQNYAYDWLVDKDLADIDFDSVTDQDLSQRYIAAVLYFALDGMNWFEQYGFLEESHVCEWNNGSSRNRMGIICDSSERITGFAINENNLRGQLPGELKALTHMTLLQLRSNHIFGTIPHGLDKLSSLEEMDLRQNDLVGTIPEEIFNLPQIKRILLLRNSQLSGTIPVTIKKASNLEMLSFQKCRITGSIPSTIGDLSNLFFFTFMENKLTGSIPESVSNLSQLEVLELSGNRLTGSIPDLVDHNHLYFLSLFDNELKGTIPSSLGLIPKLMFLDIRNNELYGTIPLSIGRLPDLVTFFAQNNQLTGKLPSFSNNKGLLQAINLSENNLSGDLVDFFNPDGPTKRLVTMNLSENNFFGSIPSSVGLFDSLGELNLRGNLFSGTIPKEIGLLQEIGALNLGENNLSGTLPEEIGLIEQLTYLNVASNQLQGTIPDTLALMSRLKILDMNSNQFVGSLPAIFGQLSNLDELYLHNNFLTGDLTDAFCTGYNFGFTYKYIEAFASDCMEPNPAVRCKCCSVCCKNGNCLNVPNAHGE